MNKTDTSQDLQALAFVEARGKTAIIGALDSMPKTADVRFFRRVNIGSGMVSVVYTGEVAAARAARDGALDLAGKIGEVVASNVIPRPHSRIYSLIAQKSGDTPDADASGNNLALGIVEVEGFTAMAEAADKGIKAADVTIPGWVTVGSGLTTVFFRGEVAAVRSSVEAASEAASKLTNVIASHLIPRLHPGTGEAVPVGCAPAKSVFKKPDKSDALGILETRGITGLIEGIDSGLKAASVIVQGWEKIGRGITSTLFRGTVADVKSAMDAAVKGASRAGEVIGSYIIARPHDELDKGR